MNRRKELRPESPQRVCQSQPYNVVGNSHYYMHVLHRKHAFQHRNVPKYRKSTDLIRKYSMSVIIETNNPRLEAARNQNVQREPPVTTGTHDSQPDSLLNVVSCTCTSGRGMLAVISGSVMALSSQRSTGHQC